MSASPQIILASTSPRRREILSLLGVPFRVVSPQFDEIWNHRRPAQENVIAFAEGKAKSLEYDFPGTIIIGSDTLIEDKSGMIGKPSGPEEAEQTLQRLQGQEHHIWTAVTLIDTAEDTVQTTVENVRIQMGPMNHHEIETYVSTGEPLDKAGAYSVQGKGHRFIQKLEGDFLSAVGLPLRPIDAFLRHRRIDCPCNIEALYREKSFLNWQDF